MYTVSRAMKRPCRKLRNLFEIYIWSLVTVLDVRLWAFMFYHPVVLSMALHSENQAAILCTLDDHGHNNSTVIAYL